MIRTIGVIGAGQMGNGIAQVFAVSGYSGAFADVSEDAGQGDRHIAKNLDRR